MYSENRLQHAAAPTVESSEGVAEVILKRRRRRQRTRPRTRRSRLAERVVSTSASLPPARESRLRQARPGAHSWATPNIACGASLLMLGAVHANSLAKAITF